jgi:hypothetical protein
MINIVSPFGVSRFTVFSAYFLSTGIQLDLRTNQLTKKPLEPNPFVSREVPVPVHLKSTTRREEKSFTDTQYRGYSQAYSA